MQRFSSSEDEKRIFLDALVTYSDACTLPELTPSCPFYEPGPRGPSCGEQCRAIAESHGVQSRTVGEFTVGGLVLTGRVLPVQSVAGVDLFDAAQKFISDHHLDPKLQSTTSLLIGLRSALMQPLLNPDKEQRHHVLEIWGELARRGIDIERIVSGALLPLLAHTLVTSAVVQSLMQEDLIRPDYSAVAPTGSDPRKSSEWAKVLDAALHSSRASARPQFRKRLDSPRRLPRPAVEWLSAIAKDNESAELIFAMDTVTYAFSPSFLGKTEEWLSCLLEENLQSLLDFAVPPVSVFQALEVVPGCRDDVGLWIWDRFTKTDLDEWALSSLLLEYRSNRGENFDAAPARIFAERLVPNEDVAELALERTAKTKGRQTHRKGLQPIHFAASAAHSLRAGDHVAAENIFSGLIELRPTDGEVWNNLGFCQLASDPGKAILSLQRGAALLRKSTPVNVANQILALHLLGEDDLALSLSRNYLETFPEITHDCFLWQHPSPDASLEVVSVRNVHKYMTELEQHITEFSCAHGGSNNQAGIPV